MARKSSKIDVVPKPGERSLKDGARWNPNMPNGRKIVQNAPQILSKSTQMAPQCFQLVPPAWFANRLGGTDAPAHAPAQTYI